MNWVTDLKSHASNGANRAKIGQWDRDTRYPMNWVTEAKSPVQGEARGSYPMNWVTDLKSRYFQYLQNEQAGNPNRGMGEYVSPEKIFVFSSLIRRGTKGVCFLLSKQGD